jgi:RNA polymerase sigma-70 factor (ECF subfamily)
MWITHIQRNLLPVRRDVIPEVLADTDVWMRGEPGTAPRGPFEREPDLVRGLAALEASAWRQLYDENYERVYAYAYLRLRHRADAEDVAASVFAEAVKGIASFRYRGIPVAAWLFRIAHHETVDALRRRGVAPLALNGDVAAARVDEVSLAMHDVGVAMGKLKAEHRDVLMLRFIEDRNVRDVAEILGKTPGAVKVLQLRALRALRRHLGGGSDR